MTTRVLMQGRVVLSNEKRRRPRPRAHLEERYCLPVAPDLGRPPSLGEVYRDTEEDLNYRIVHPLNPLDGWCLMDQLIVHYQLPAKVILKWCRMGLIDAVIEYGSAVRRYRVRAEDKVELLAKQLRARIAVRSRDTVELRELMRRRVLTRKFLKRKV